MKIVWIDGPLGIGKTEVANAVVKGLDNAYVLEFDSLQNKYKPKLLSDILGQRYPSSKIH